MGRGGNVHCSWGNNIILGKKGVGQKYHILGKYTSLADIMTNKICLPNISFAIGCWFNCFFRQFLSNMCMRSGRKGMDMLGGYEGYKAKVKASVSNEFATAAYRNIFTFYFETQGAKVKKFTNISPRILRIDYNILSFYPFS